MKFLVTAGPTREAIDPVRFLSNRSTGKMGYAVAGAARRAGHHVRLIFGPVALAVPGGVEGIPVTTAAEMCTAVETDLPWCDVLVMVAAVADWRPVQVADRKLKKREMTPLIHLERTVDILEHIRQQKGGRLMVGFAAETGRVLEEARRKLQEKDLDLIVANDVSDPHSGFAVDTNRVLFVERGGATREFPLLTKDDVAAHIVTWIESKSASQCPR